MANRRAGTPPLERGKGTGGLGFLYYHRSALLYAQPPLDGLPSGEKRVSKPVVPLEDFVAKAETKPLRAITGADFRRGVIAMLAAGWYASDGEWFCVVCNRAETPQSKWVKVPKGAPVYYAGVIGLFYCSKHAPGDAVHAPAHTEGS